MVNFKFYFYPITVEAIDEIEAVDKVYEKIEKGEIHINFCTDLPNSELFKDKPIREILK